MPEVLRRASSVALALVLLLVPEAGSAVAQVVCGVFTCGEPQAGSTGTMTVTRSGTYVFQGDTYDQTTTATFTVAADGSVSVVGSHLRTYTFAGCFITESDSASGPVAGKPTLIRAADGTYEVTDLPIVTMTGVTTSTCKPPSPDSSPFQFNGYVFGTAAVGATDLAGSQTFPPNSRYNVTVVPVTATWHLKIGYDLKAISVSAIQAVFDPLALVRDKLTVIDAEIENTFPTAQSVDVKVTWSDLGGADPGPRSLTETLSMPRGKHHYFLALNGIRPHGTQFDASITIDPDNKVAESDRTNNHASMSAPIAVKETRLNVLFVPLVPDGETFTGCADLVALRNGSRGYLNAAYPIAESIFTADCLMTVRSPAHPLYQGDKIPIWDALAAIAKVNGYDHAIGVTRPGWFNDFAPGHTTAAGETLIPTSWLVSQVHSSIIEQEFNGGFVTAHSRGWVSNGDPVESAAWPRHTDPAMKVDGYLIGSGKLTDISELMNPFAGPAPGDSRWPSTATFNFMLNQLKVNAADPPLIFVRAVIGLDGTASLAPWYRFDGVPDPEPGLASDYELAFLDANGNVIALKGLSPSFQELTPSGIVATTVSGVAVAVPDVPGTARIALMRGAVTLAQRAVTAHAPVVQLVAPVAGTQFAMGTTVSVEWQASDADQDPLAFAASLSVDGGSTWLPVAFDFAGSQLSFVVSSDLSTKAAIVRILATDGINTTETRSGTFSLGGTISSNHPPTANAGPDSTVDEGGTVTLDGSLSSDPDSDPLTYAWTLVSGTPAVSLSSATAVKTTFVTTDNATYLFRLTVTDTHGAAAFADTLVSVRDVPPTAAAASNGPKYWGQPVHFTGSASDPSPVDTAAGFAGAWTFGDSASGAGMGADHSYSTPDSYTASFTATDKDGGISVPAQTSVRIDRRPTALSCANLRSVYGTSATLSATLTDTFAGASIAGPVITYALDGTSVPGAAASALTPAGAHAITATFARSSLFTGSTATCTLTVDKSPTALAFSSAIRFVNGTPTMLSAVLTRSGTGEPVGGGLVTFVLGSGNTAQRCTATTGRTGIASCSVIAAQPVGTVPVSATYAGDANHLPSSTAAAIARPLYDVLPLAANLDATVPTGPVRLQPADHTGGGGTFDFQSFVPPPCIISDANCYRRALREGASGVISFAVRGVRGSGVYASARFDVTSLSLEAAETLQQRVNSAPTETCASFARGSRRVVMIPIMDGNAGNDTVRLLRAQPFFIMRVDGRNGFSGCFVR